MSSEVNRWEWLEGVKAETPTRVAVRELCKLVAKELGDWPPQVDWSGEAAQSRFAPLYDPPHQPPSAAAIEEALRRVRFEMERNFEAIDHYERNHLLAKACADARDRLASEFVYRFLSEAFLELIERTDNRVRRRDLLEGMDELARLLPY